MRLVPYPLHRSSGPIVLLALAFALGAGEAQAQSKTGTTIGQFLMIEASARRDDNRLDVFHVGTEPLHQRAHRRNQNPRHACGITQTPHRAESPAHRGHAGALTPGRRRNAGTNELTYVFCRDSLDGDRPKTLVQEDREADQQFRHAVGALVRELGSAKLLEDVPESLTRGSVSVDQGDLVGSRCVHAGGAHPGTLEHVGTSLKVSAKPRGAETPPGPFLCF